MSSTSNTLLLSKMDILFAHFIGDGGAGSVHIHLGKEEAEPAMLGARRSQAHLRWSSTSPLSPNVANNPLHTAHARSLLASSISARESPCSPLAPAWVRPNILPSPNHPVHIHPARPLYRFMGTALGASMWFFVGSELEVMRSRADFGS